MEFFPPKSGEGISRFNKAADELVPFGFGFASVTYGAGGSTREGTLTAARELKKRFKEGVPHVSCYGSDKKSIRTAKNLLKRWFSRLVILRGDLPSGYGGLGEFKNAVDLVRFVRREFGDQFKIEVAAYPEKHPQSHSFDKILTILLKKLTLEQTEQ